MIHRTCASLPFVPKYQNFGRKWTRKNVGSPTVANATFSLPLQLVASPSLSPSLLPVVVDVKPLPPVDGKKNHQRAGRGVQLCNSEPAWEGPVCARCGEEFSLLAVNAATVFSVLGSRVGLLAISSTQLVGRTRISNSTMRRTNLAYNARKTCNHETTSVNYPCPLSVPISLPDDGCNVRL